MYFTPVQNVIRANLAPCYFVHSCNFVLVQFRPVAIKNMSKLNRQTKQMSKTLTWLWHYRFLFLCDVIYDVIGGRRGSSRHLLSDQLKFFGTEARSDVTNLAFVHGEGEGGAHSPVGARSASVS